MKKTFELNERFCKVYDLLCERGDIVKNGRGDKSKRSFARKLGVESHVVDRYLRGEARFPMEKIEILQREYRVSSLYMRLGAGEPFADFFEAASTQDEVFGNQRPELEGNILFAQDIEAIAGPGVEAATQEKVVRFNIPGISGEAAAFYVSGNSMNPTIQDGDLVICRPIHEIRDMKENEIYLIAAKGAVMIKRLQRIFDTRGRWIALRCISDNHLEFPSFEVDLNDVNRIYKVTNKLTGV